MCHILCEWCRADYFYRLYLSVCSSLMTLMIIQVCRHLTLVNCILCVCLNVCTKQFTFEISSDHLFLIFTGSTLSALTYSRYDDDCTGEFTMETHTIGACSTGGVKYQIVPGTASLVPSLAPTAFSSALTLELSGYSVAAQYSDDKCTLITSAVSYPLNSCNDYTSTYPYYYAKSTATAYTITRTVCFDPLCKTAASRTDPTYLDYTASCATTSKMQSTLAFVNSNGVPPSSLTMASIRLVHIMSHPCVMASLPYLLSFLFCLTVSYPI